MIVVKLGSSVLATDAAVPAAVAEIYAHVRAGRAVVAVVSAIGDTTDRLLARGQALGATGSALAALLATGEAESAALLASALDRAGIPCSLLDPARAGLRAEGDPLDARLVSVDAAAIRGHLQEAAVAVIPGFVARDPGGRTCVLGRGGSDLTALFLARALGARCRLVKDVPGLFEWDPRDGGAPGVYRRATWERALAIGGGVVQEKALRFAWSEGLELEIAALGASSGTVVGAGPCEVGAVAPSRPTRVGLLGLGTVGLGVYRHLAASPDRFAVTGIAVRDPARHAGDRIAPGLLGADCAAVARGCDVLVELIGGIEPARGVVERALRDGKAVVTANKLLLALHGDALRAIPGARLLGSAAVGGSVPVLEAVERLAGEIERIEGVINGTCNFVLDRMGGGAAQADAVREAQEAGFAEADPTQDLDGGDAAAKLAVLCGAAWGTRPRVDRRGIEDLGPEDVRRAREDGQAIRLVASADGDGARVAPRWLPRSHPLASTSGEENRVILHTRRGAVHLRGKGAGRWPTAQSVLADLWSL